MIFRGYQFSLLSCLVAFSSGTFFVNAEDTFPNQGRYVSDLTLATRSLGAGTTERLRNEPGGLSDSWGEVFETDRDPRTSAANLKSQRSTYGLVDRSRGLLSARASLSKVRLNDDRTDTQSLSTINNRASQLDWVIFRDSRDLDDDTTPFELKVVYNVRFLSGNTGTATSASENFSASFVFGDDDGEQLVDHVARFRRVNSQPPVSSGLGTFEETFTLLPGERFQISWLAEADVSAGFRLLDGVNSRIIAGGGALTWSIRLEAPDFIVQSASKSGHQWLGVQAALRSGAPRAKVERFLIEPGQRELQASTTPGATYRAFMSNDLSAFAPAGFPVEAEGTSTTFELTEEMFAGSRGFFWVEQVLPAGS